MLRLYPTLSISPTVTRGTQPLRVLALGFELESLRSSPRPLQPCSQQPREASVTTNPEVWVFSVLAELGHSNCVAQAGGGRDYPELAPPRRPPSLEAPAHKSLHFLQKGWAGEGPDLSSKFQCAAKGWNQPRKPGVPSRHGCQGAPPPPPPGRAHTARVPTPQSRSQARARGQFPGGDQQEISWAPGQRLPSQSSWRPLCSSLHSL